MARSSAIGWLILIVLGVGWCSNQSGKSSPTVASTRPAIQAPVSVPANSEPAFQPTQNVSVAPRTVAPQASAATTLYTTANVRLRTEPSTDAGIILTISGGSAVKSTRSDGLWHHVAYGNYSGWIRGDYLATDRREPQRSAPSTAMPLVSAPVRTRTTQSARRSSSRHYIRGPRGGCYYINRNGNKTYVSRSLC
jgi:uncharacterized protein YraI